MVIRWEMYDVFKKATLEESLLMKLELSQQPADKNAKQALGNEEAESCL